jgi:glycosyltransferase involved in cell wall biosynthesis
MLKHRVAILYKYLPLYRYDFFNKLSELCEANEIDLKILYGDPDRDDSVKLNATEFSRPGGRYVPNRFVNLGKIELIWQPVLRHIGPADLVIVEQANRLLINYWLIARQLSGAQKFAFWGHGKNLQARNPDSISEMVKRRLVCTPHWWFAYTESTAAYLRKVGFPKDRITVVMNAIDTDELVKRRNGTSPAQVAAERKRIGIHTDNVCIYVGSMYSHKRIDFLLQACHRIKCIVPDFQMIFIGAGVDDHLVKTFCDNNSWAIYLGSVHGREKVKYFMMSKLFLMPGLVGLAVLDSFAAGVPLVTTDVPYHSPEIEYVRSGYNGLIVSPCEDVDLFATKVAELLLHEGRRKEVVRNCLASAALYTTDNMANRFLDGLRKALTL